MSTLFSTNAIILSRRDHREADRWYSAITPDGKIEFLARGSHKPLAKLSPHLEMPGEVELLLVEGRAFRTVAGVERRQAYSTAYSDYTKLTLIMNALHLVDIGTRVDDPDTGVYALLSEWCAAVNAAPTPSDERAGYWLSAFTLKLLSRIGYHPELAACLACTRALEPGAFRWHATKGGVVCTVCTARDAEQWFAARPLSDEALKLTRFALQAPFGEHLRPHLPGQTLAEVHDAVESLVVAHFPAIPANSIRGACVA